jgi:hypothetical protein
MGDMADMLREQEENMLLDHQMRECGGLGVCSLCDFESMTRLSVTVGKHLFIVSFLHLLKEDSFAIRAFLLKLGPYNPDVEGHVVRKERMSLKDFKEAVEQFTDVDVVYSKFGPIAVIYTLGGLPCGAMSHPFTEFFRLEDRPSSKMIW